MPKRFPAAFLGCIDSTQINHVRAGPGREKYTGIWMVQVKGRIFARSYYLKERSWYNTFIETESGEIKCAKAAVSVRGIKPGDLATITSLVNAAYQKKYGVRPSNQKWIDGLCEPARVEKTMEFVPV